jgi:3-methyladenine DNA glycosylase AlkD
MEQTLSQIQWTAVQWTAANYAEFIAYLKTLADKKYRAFHMSIVNDGSAEYIGVRIPVLDTFVRQIAGGDWRGFLKYNTHRYYEELILHGKLIGKVKTDYTLLMQMLNDFLPHIKNWAVCDSTICKFRQIKNNEAAALAQIERWLSDKNPWTNRAGLKMLHSNFVNAQYIDTVLDFCKQATSDHYYVKMMAAWLVCECYIKFPAQTHKLLQSGRLSAWVQNKAIQKIRESFRTPPAAKQALLKLKR